MSGIISEQWQGVRPAAARALRPRGTERTTRRRHVPVLRGQRGADW